MNRSRTILLSTVAAGVAVAGASYLTRRAESRLMLESGVIPIVTPFIDIRVAEDVLALMERLPGERVTLVLHTMGGCVTACVLIANALREFGESTAVVPYMAISGGTLIALNAAHLEMGQRASLSAVDPVIMGQRVKHLAETKDDPGLAGLAREYETSMRKYLRETLDARLDSSRVDAAMVKFIGEHAPHGWPIRRHEVEELGIPVAPTAARWTALVDHFRGHE
jgi:pimeloyl-ACP methyl ester carboxylesterase